MMAFSCAVFALPAALDLPPEVPRRDSILAL
jgi:hypothetical protein